MIPRQEAHHLWGVLGAPDALKVDLPRGPWDRLADVARVRALPKGATVVVAGTGPLADARCERFARTAGIEVRRGFFLFPSARSPVYAVSAGADSIGYFVSSVLTVPPGTTTLTGLMDGVMSMVRRFSSRRLMRTVAPGFVAVGRRT